MVHFVIPAAQQSCWGVYWYYSIRPSICPSVRLSVRLFNSLTSCVGSCYQTETANQWVCGTAVLPVGTLHSLEWFWVSRRIFIYSHHNMTVFFSKTSVRPSVRLSRILCPLHTVLVGSISYLYILSNFKIWIFGNFLKFVSLTLSSFDLGSDVNQ